MLCLGQIVITTLGSQYHSSSDPHGPIQTNDGDPKSIQVESKGKDCSSGYVSVAQSISERQWCIKNCASCAMLEDGTYRAPDSNPKPCDCVVGSKYNERSRVGTKVTMTGGVCVYLSADYQGSVKGKVDLELLKKGIAKIAGLFGGDASLELGIVGDLNIGATVSVPFTYSKTTWAGDALPALSCRL